MSYTMNDVQRVTGNLMAKPILDFLPKREGYEYLVRSSNINFDDDETIGEKLTILERSSSGFRRIFPRKLARVKVYHFFQRVDVEAKTFDKILLPQDKLEALFNGVDFNSISAAAGFAGQNAVDYN